MDYLGHSKEGRVRDRIKALITHVLEKLEAAHELRAKPEDTVPERVKTLRQTVIRKLEECTENGHHGGLELATHMEDLFFVMQLFSYRGDYLVDSPSIERIAETIDKFEEDILDRSYPSVKGRRRVRIAFGDAIAVTAEKGRDAVANLTGQLQNGAQSLVDALR